MCHASCVYYYYCKLFGTMPRRLFNSTLHVSLTSRHTSLLPILLSVFVLKPPTPSMAILSVFRIYLVYFYYALGRLCVY